MENTATVALSEKLIATCLAYRGLSVLASGTIEHTTEAWQIESDALASS